VGSSPTIDSNQQTAKVCESLHGLVDPLGHIGKLSTHLCAGDDPAVVSAPPMQVDKVTSIDRQNRPTASGCECQDSFIDDTATGLPHIRSREGIVAQFTQLINDWFGKTFVGVESSHPQASSFSRISL